MSPTRVFLVDDHQLFLSGVRAELGDEVEVVGSASDVDAGDRDDPRPHPRRGARRRAHAERRWRPGDRGSARDASRHAVPRVVGERRARRRDRDDPRRRARLRDEDDRARRSRRRDRRGCGRRRGVLAAPRGLRARRVLQRGAAGNRSGARTADTARARGAAADRARVTRTRKSRAISASR